MAKSDTFTDAKIRALKPKQSRYDVSEGKEGFEVRVFPSGKRSFIYRYTSPLTGQRRRMTLGSYPTMTLAKARIAHGEARQSVLEGKDPAADKIAADAAMREVSTVNDLLAEYLEAKSDKRSVGEAERLLNHDLVPVLGKYRVTDIDRRQVNAVLDRPKKRGSKTVENRLFAAMRGMFRWAVQQGLIDHAPTEGMVMRNREKERDRRVDGDGLGDFWEAIDTLDCSEPVRIALRLLLVTGQRRGEVAGMKSADVRGDVWTIPETKNGRAHKVPLSRLALDLIRQAKQWNGTSDYLFPSGEGHIHPDALTRAMVRGRDKLGVTPHDLRRTVASEMIALGISPHVVGEVLNHTRQGVTMKHYARHDFASEKRDALDRWSDRLIEAVPGLAPPENVVEIKRPWRRV